MRNGNRLNSHRAPLPWMLGFVLLTAACADNDASYSSGDGYETAATSAELRVRTPNILLIIADDYGVDVSGQYTDLGADAFPTPHLDALARRGVVFENAWSNPTCSPTRATILTGRYGFRTGVGFGVNEFTTNDGLLDVNAEVTLPKAFKAAGTQYALANIGKWHVSRGVDDPNLAGWDHYAGNLYAGLDDYWSWEKVTNGVETQSTTYATTDSVNDSVAWIADQEANGRPWLLWLALNAPHAPFHLPPSHLHGFDDLPGTPGDIAANTRAYYKAMVQAMDTEIGRLLSGLDLSNTYVVFVGDNGTPGNVVAEPFDSARSKFTVYQGGVHVPLIVAGPDVSRRRSERLVNTSDIYSTLLELAGIAVNDVVPSGVTLDSVSFASDLFGTATRRGWSYTEQFATGGQVGLPFDVSLAQVIRDERYKLIAHTSGDEELFDLDGDPLENDNLLDGRSLPRHVRAHYDRLVNTMTRLTNP